MKKNLLKIAFLLGVSVVVAMSFDAKKEDFSRLIKLENIEALAGPDSSPNPTPSSIDCWNTVTNTGAGRQTHYSYCGTCTAVLSRDVSDKDHCPK